MLICIWACGLPFTLRILFGCVCLTRERESDHAVEVYKSCKHGAFICKDIDDIMMLLFAGDVNVFLYTVLGLQQQLMLCINFNLTWCLGV